MDVIWPTVGTARTLARLAHATSKRVMQLKIENHAYKTSLKPRACMGCNGEMLKNVLYTYIYIMHYLVNGSASLYETPGDVRPCPESGVYSGAG